MWEFINRFDSTTLGMLTFFLMSLLAIVATVLTIVIVQYRHTARLKDQEHSLKREMLAKGMSAAEIERVIQASAEKETAKTEEIKWDSGEGSRAGPAAASGAPVKGFDKTRMVQALVEQGMDAAGIEKLLRVLAECADDEMPAKVSAIESMVEQGMEASDIERVIRAFHHAPTSAERVAKEGQTAFRE
jgi:hypothetical protein